MLLLLKLKFLAGRGKLLLVCGIYLGALAAIRVE